MYWPPGTTEEGVTTPAVVMRPVGIVNQSAPSGPRVMARAPWVAGSAYSVTVPDGVLLASSCGTPRVSVNHTFPSDPGAMPNGLEGDVGIENSVIVCAAIGPATAATNRLGAEIKRIERIRA